MPAEAESVEAAFEEFKAELDFAADNLDEETVRRAAVEAMIPVALDAKANAPVDEGDLRESITVESFEESPRELDDEFDAAALVGGTYYGLFVEIGADQPAQPWLRPAFDTNREEIAERFAKSLEESMFEDFG